MGFCVLFVLAFLLAIFCGQMIRMGVDPDGCEWVNVSSGTGLPGFSRIKGR